MKIDIKKFEDGGLDMVRISAESDVKPHHAVIGAGVPQWALELQEVYKDEIADLGEFGFAKLLMRLFTECDFVKVGRVYKLSGEFAIGGARC